MLTNYTQAEQKENTEPPLVILSGHFFMDFFGLLFQGVKKTLFFSNMLFFLLFYPKVSLMATVSHDKSEFPIKALFQSLSLYPLNYLF